MLLLLVVTTGMCLGVEATCQSRRSLGDMINSRTSDI